MKRYLSAFATLVMLCLVSCNGGDKPASTEEPSSANPNVPANIPYQIINTYPHDTSAFTEGLQFVDGKLYESTGNYGKSDFRITDLKTGTPEKKVPMDKKYFGEGLTVLNGKIYQLTYQEKTGFVYDAKTLKPEKTFTFNQGEGWGLTNDGKNLIMSNGSSNLFFLDPNTLQEVNRLGVTNQYGQVSNINELEYIKGYIYANQWQNDVIFKIDPSSGKVVGVVDMSKLREQTGIPQPDQMTGEGPDVLNGIAYDSAQNKIYITGKNWPKLFEVKLDN
jgi:glutaminyl-peptide cyclotransferase